jgi:hypothetical protein
MGNTSGALLSTPTRRGLATAPEPTPRPRSGRPRLGPGPWTSTLSSSRGPGRLVGGDRPVAGVVERWDLVSPGVPELGEALHSHHRRARARIDAVAGVAHGRRPSTCHGPRASHSGHSHRSFRVPPVTPTNSRQPLPSAVPLQLPIATHQEISTSSYSPIIAVRTLAFGYFRHEIV